MLKTVVCLALFLATLGNSHHHHHHWNLEKCKREFNYEGDFHPDDWPLTNQTACIAACTAKKCELMLPNNTYSLPKAMEMVSKMEKCNETRPMMMDKMNRMTNMSTPPSNPPPYHSHPPPPCPTKEMVNNIKKMFINCITDKQTVVADQCDAAMKMNKCFHDFRVKYNMPDMKTSMQQPTPQSRM